MKFSPVIDRVAPFCLCLASAQDKDYVHLLTAAVAAQTGGRQLLETASIDGTKSVENVFNIANVLEREAPWR